MGTSGSSACITFRFLRRPLNGQMAADDTSVGSTPTWRSGAATGKDGNAAKLEAMRKGDAGEVLQYLQEQSFIDETLLDTETNRTLHLAEIHAAPQWLWAALVNAMVANNWTVQVTRDNAQEEPYPFAAARARPPSQPRPRCPSQPNPSHFFGNPSHFLATFSGKWLGTTL